VTLVDDVRIGEFLGVEAMRLVGVEHFRFEVIRPDRILNLAVHVQEMTVTVELFGRQGGQPLSSLWIDYLEFNVLFLAPRRERQAIATTRATKGRDQSLLAYQAGHPYAYTRRANSNEPVGPIPKKRFDGKQANNGERTAEQDKVDEMALP
jgi:hypothetical protein